MRNRASELRIPRSDSLPLGHRLHGERDIFCIWSFCIKRSVVKVPNLFPFRILIFTSIQRSPPRSLQRSAARGTGLSPVKAWIFSGFFSAIVRNISLFDFIRKFSKNFFHEQLWTFYLFHLHLSLTIFLCSLHHNRALWSITIRSIGQHLEFIFCELIKPSDTYI